MKKLLKYLNIAVLLAVLSAGFAACSEDDEEDYGNVGLGIKVFSPTMVVPGQAMTINGSGFDKVVEVVFPGDITVTDFEIVTGEMIRVNAPLSLKEEGTIQVRDSEGATAVSRLSLQLGEPEITNFSALEGDTIKGKESLTIYGKDLLCIESAEFLDEDSAALVVKAEDFTRITATRVVIPVPAKVYDGLFAVKINMGGKVIETPVYKFEPTIENGYWEITRRFLWQNESGAAVAGWGGTFRFSNVEKSTGEEIYAFPMEDWAIIKDGEVFALVDVTESSNIRITDGWWKQAYGGPEHNCLDLAEEDETSGKMVIKLDIKSYPDLYNIIDEQHLLFTGDAYTLLGLFVEESTWIEGEAGHYEHKTLWKNESGAAVAGWGGTFRFSNAEASTGEECYAFPMEDWAIIKDGIFRVGVVATEASNIRITDGWWKQAYGGPEHNCLDLVQEDANGNQYIELEMKSYPDLYNIIDVQHLLFTGDAYTITEIYIEEWVEGGAAGPQEIDLWKNETGEAIAGWGGTFRFSNAEASTGEECYAFPMEDWAIIKDGTFRVGVVATEASNIRITDGWWKQAYGGSEHNCLDLVQEDANGNQYIELEMKSYPDLYNIIDVQHLLFTGDAYTITKIYYLK